MLLIGLLIQNRGITQNPVKVYHRMVPSQARIPDSEELLTIPAHTTHTGCVLPATLGDTAH